MKKIIALLLALVMVLGFVACAKTEEPVAEEAGETETAEEPAFKVCLVCGSLGDNSFADSAYAGMLRLQDELGCEITVKEYGSDSTKLPTYFLDAADEGYNLIIFNYDIDALAKLGEVAGDYPDTFFGIYDVWGDWSIDVPNAQGWNFKVYEAEYLAGAMGAKMSKTGVIGFMGGDDNTGIRDFEVGYLEGCGYANPDAKVASSYIAAGSASWSDPAKGKELALALINNKNADFVHGVAGQSGDGACEAVAETKAAGKDVWFIGVDKDQYVTYNATDNADWADVTITSVLKTIGTPIYNLAQSLMNGETPESGLIFLGMNEGGTGIAENDYYKANVPQDVQDFITETAGKVSSGEIKVSTAVGMDEETFQGLRDTYGIE